MASRIDLLLADDDARLRSLLATYARDTVGSLTVLEAGDGAEALQIGPQRRPQIALLDVNMPRLSGIEVALTLREQEPQTRIALQTADPSAYRERARESGLILFDKLHLERAFHWVELQARACARPNQVLECAACGYGVARATPPDRCPMCQSEDTWVELRSRAFAALR